MQGEQQKLPFFFYGSLKPGEEREHVVAEAVAMAKLIIADSDKKWPSREQEKEAAKEITITKGATVGALYALVQGFPGAFFLPSVETQVQGVLVTVPDYAFETVLRHIDQIEQFYGANDKKNLYNRFQVEVEVERGKTVTAISYSPAEDFWSRVNHPKEDWIPKPVLLEDGIWTQGKYGYNYFRKLAEIAYNKVHAETEDAVAEDTPR